MDVAQGSPERLWDYLSLEEKHQDINPSLWRRVLPFRSRLRFDFMRFGMERDSLKDGADDGSFSSLRIVLGMGSLDIRLNGFRFEPLEGDGGGLGARSA